MFKRIPFCVSVPVLSLSKYSILPSSSGSVLVLTMVLGIALSLIICWAYNVLPISKFTRSLSRVSIFRHMIILGDLRNRNDGREENEKPKEVDPPRASEPVQSHKNQRQGERHAAQDLIMKLSKLSYSGSPRPYLGKIVDFKVQ